MAHPDRGSQYPSEHSQQPLRKQWTPTQAQVVGKHGQAHAHQPDLVAGDPAQPRVQGHALPFGLAYVHALVVDHTPVVADDYDMDRAHDQVGVVAEKVYMVVMVGHAPGRVAAHEHVGESDHGLGVADDNHDHGLGVADYTHAQDLVVADDNHDHDLVVADDNHDQDLGGR